MSFLFCPRADFQPPWQRHGGDRLRVAHCLLCRTGNGFPRLTEAGILAVPDGDRKALAGMLQNILADQRLRSELSIRSRSAHEKYFSWPAITARFAAELHIKNRIEDVARQKG